MVNMLGDLKLTYCNSSKHTLATICCSCIYILGSHSNHINIYIFSIQINKEINAYAQNPQGYLLEQLKSCAGFSWWGGRGGDSLNLVDVLTKSYCNCNYSGCSMLARWSLQVHHISVQFSSLCSHILQLKWLRRNKEKFKIASSAFQKMRVCRNMVLTESTLWCHKWHWYLTLHETPQASHIYPSLAAT